MSCGTVVHWNEAESYGFLACDSTNERVYFNRAALQRPTASVSIGQRYGFEIVASPHGHETGRARNMRLVVHNNGMPVAVAEQATPRKTPREQSYSRSSRVLSRLLTFVLCMIALGALAVGTILSLLNDLPKLVGPSMILMSIITYATYVHDKNAARNQAFRVPEAQLHLFSILGGWPGAILAQRIWRHKTRKVSFLAAFSVCIIIHIGALVGLHTKSLPGLRSYVRNNLRTPPPSIQMSVSAPPPSTPTPKQPDGRKKTTKPSASERGSRSMNSANAITSSTLAHETQREESETTPPRSRSGKRKSSTR